MSANSDKTQKFRISKNAKQVVFILFCLTNKKKRDLKQKNWILYLRDFDMYTCNRMLSSVSCCLRISEGGPKRNTKR